MKKSAHVVLVALIVLVTLGMSNNAKAGGIFDFFGNNRQILAELEANPKKVLYVKPLEPPAGVSSFEAWSLRTGGQPIVKVKCPSQFLSFLMDGLEVVRECTETTIGLTSSHPFYDIGVVTKKRPTEGSLMIIWPLIGIGGIISLALIFVSKNAPAKFLLQYGVGLLAMMTLLVATNSLLLLESAGKFVAGIVCWGSLMIIFYQRSGGLVYKWRFKYQASDNNVLLELFGAWGLIFTPLVFALVPMATPGLPNGRDLLLFIGVWIVLLSLSMVAIRQRPQFRKKYLNWV